MKSPRSCFSDINCDFILNIADSRVQSSSRDTNIGNWRMSVSSWMRIQMSSQRSRDWRWVTNGWVLSSDSDCKRTSSDVDAIIFHSNLILSRYTWHVVYFDTSIMIVWVLNIRSGRSFDSNSKSSITSSIVINSKVVVHMSSSRDQSRTNCHDRCHCSWWEQTVNTHKKLKSQTQDDYWSNDTEV